MPFKFSDVKVSLSNIYRNEVNRIPKYSLALVYETQRSRVLDIFLLFHKKKKNPPSKCCLQNQKRNKATSGIYNGWHLCIYYKAGYYAKPYELCKLLSLVYTWETLRIVRIKAWIQLGWIMPAPLHYHHHHHKHHLQHCHHHNCYHHCYHYQCHHHHDNQHPIFCLNLCFWRCQLPQYNWSGGSCKDRKNVELIFKIYTPKGSSIVETKNIYSPGNSYTKQNEKTIIICNSASVYMEVFQLWK